MTNWGFKNKKVRKLEQNLCVSDACTVYKEWSKTKWEKKNIIELLSKK